MDTAVQDVLDFAATLSPTILISKIKFHIVSHIIEHVKWFGPAVLFSTERYESFNRVFRLCSIHSNRQAPSRDIAHTSAHLDRCRHIMTGGKWLDTRTKQWVCASSQVLKHLEDNSTDARLLGVFKEKHTPPGTLSLPRMPKADNGNRARERPLPKTWDGLEVAQDIPRLPSTCSPNTQWYEAESLVTTSGDKAYVGSEVIFRSEQVLY